MKEGFNFRDIKSFEDACNHLGISSEIPTMPSNFISQYKLEIIIRAINNGWKSDFTNINQYKYYPYFETNASGVSTYRTTTFYYDDYRYLPLAFYLESCEKAEYMGKKFKHLYDET